MSIKKTGQRSFVLRAQWRDAKTGRKRSLTEHYEGTLRGAELRRAKLLTDAKASGDKRQRQRMEAFARSWMQSRAPRIKPSTAVRYASALDKHILPALGDYWLDRLDRDDVQAYVNARTGEGAEGHTVMNELRLLRAMARDAVADKVCVVNWADRVTPPAVRKWTEERPNLFTAAQLAAVLGAVPKRWLPAVTLSAFTGLRWGEMSALRWSDIDPVEGSIKIRRSNWRGRIGTPKTDPFHTNGGTDSLQASC